MGTAVAQNTETLPRFWGRGEGRGRALSVGRADSSPRGRAKRDGTQAVPYMEREVWNMEYTKEDYIRFIGELLELLPVGFVKKIYSIVANERKRAGV